jgi:hypothetical protein
MIVREIRSGCEPADLALSQAYCVFRSALLSIPTIFPQIRRAANSVSAAVAFFDFWSYPQASFPCAPFLWPLVRVQCEYPTCIQPQQRELRSRQQDPDAVTNLQLFHTRAFHSCMTPLEVNLF